MPDCLTALFSVSRSTARVSLTTDESEREFPRSHVPQSHVPTLFKLGLLHACLLLGEPLLRPPLFLPHNLIDLLPVLPSKHTNPIPTLNHPRSSLITRRTPPSFLHTSALPTSEVRPLQTQQTQHNHGPFSVAFSCCIAVTSRDDETTKRRDDETTRLQTARLRERLAGGSVIPPPPPPGSVVTRS